MEENLRIKPLQDYATLLQTITPSDAKVERAVPKAEVKSQNEQSMAALKAMMSGVRKRK